MIGLSVHNPEVNEISHEKLLPTPEKTFMFHYTVYPKPKIN